MRSCCAQEGADVAIVFAPGWPTAIEGRGSPLQMNPLLRWDRAAVARYLPALTKKDDTRKGKATDVLLTSMELQS